MNICVNVVSSSFCRLTINQPRVVTVNPSSRDHLKNWGGNRFSLSPSTPEQKMIARVSFNYPVRRQRAHSPYPPGRIRCVLMELHSSLPLPVVTVSIRRTVPCYGVSPPEYIRSRNCPSMALDQNRESAGAGSGGIPQG